MIRIENLHYSQSDQKIIGNLNLCFAPGSVNIIFGPSGCGKTSLLRLIAGLEIPVSGTIRNNDQIWSEKNFILPPWQRNVDMLFQADALWPNMTVGQQIAWAGRQRKENAGNDISPEIIETLQVNHLVDRYPAGLSGGEAKRCQLARVLASGAETILLDEPLAAQDKETAGNTAGLLKQILAKSQSTLIIVSHEITLLRHPDWNFIFLPDKNQI